LKPRRPQVSERPPPVTGLDFTLAARAGRDPPGSIRSE
jgi:hypothetical protein